MLRGWHGMVWRYTGVLRLYGCPSGSGVCSLSQEDTVDCTASGWQALNVFVALETGQCVMHTNEHMTQLERSAALQRLQKTCAKWGPGNRSVGNPLDWVWGDGDGGHPGSEETVIMHKSTRGIRNELHSKRNELFADSQPWRKSSQSFWQPKMSPTCQAAESFGPAP